MLAVGMTLKEQVDANIRTLSGDLAYTREDRNLLAEFSAKLFDTDTIKKMKIEGRSTADLWAAIIEGNVEAVTQSLAAGTPVNMREPQGGATPLHLCALFGQAKIAELLIEKGADISMTNNDGNTALHLASFFAHSDLVELLLKHGASVRAKNRRGETPADLIAAEWSPQLEAVYTSIANTIAMPIDLPRIRETRPQIAKVLRDREKANG
jgi:ankyrin repeat protein